MFNTGNSGLRYLVFWGMYTYVHCSVLSLNEVGPPPLRPALIWLTRGSHLRATCEAFVTRIEICDIVKSVLDHLVIPFCMKLLIAWFSVVQRSNCSHELFILQFGGHLDPLTVVTFCWSVCDRNQNVWSAKCVLDRLIVPFWGSW